MEFESRESFRVDSENFISYRVFNADDQVFFEGMATTTDISRTGIAIITTDSVETGLKIELAIGVGNEVVKTIGKVRNQKKNSDNEFQVGIEFDFLSESDLDKLSTVYPDINK
ncbi:MAG: PilZ domain-containing protein [Calditrichaeota bacterium]|nr:MAG: PilZ domain-containing protein [Calditrichota bacterium]MBL1207555.1 PilZ domain-containing protein [Calditrichota bacterium]NOG47387.1 PilZ domain-containing protein [Calditrichota bacterium]